MVDVFMRFIRNVLLIVFFTLTALAASLWAVTYWVNPNTFKVIAKKQLSTLTKQDSAIEGTVNWRLFPRPGLHITSVRIGNPQQADAVYSLFVDNLLFNVRIMPLFQGQLVFNQLVLDGFTLRVNLEGTPAHHLPEKKPHSPTIHATSLPSRVALKSLLLTNGQIILTHHTTVHATLSHVRLEAWFPKSKYDQVPIQLKANVTNDSTTSPFRTALNYKGLIRLAPHTDEASSSRLDNLELDGQLALQNLLFRSHEITKADTHLLFNHNTLHLNPLTLSLYNGESIGQLSYQLESKQLDINQTGTTLNAEPVFQNIFGNKPPHVTGTLDFSLHASAYLNDPTWLKKSNLNGSVTLRDGTLAYVNLREITHDATQTIKNLATQNLNVIQTTLEQLKPWSLNDYSGSTPFQLINLQYKTNGDALLLYSLLLETKKLHLKGQGDLNLETNDVTAHLTANFATHDPTIQAIQQLLVHGFPLVVSGKLDDLVIHPDRTMIKNFLSHGVLPQHFSKPIQLMKQHLKQLQHKPDDAPTSE